MLPYTRWVWICSIHRQCNPSSIFFTLSACVKPRKCLGEWSDCRHSFMVYREEQSIALAGVWCSSYAIKKDIICGVDLARVKNGVIWYWHISSGQIKREQNMNSVSTSLLYMPGYQLGIVWWVLHIERSRKGIRVGMASNPPDGDCIMVAAPEVRNPLPGHRTFSL